MAKQFYDKDGFPCSAPKHYTFDYDIADEKINERYVDENGVVTPYYGRKRFGSVEGWNKYVNSIGRPDLQD